MTGFLLRGILPLLLLASTVLAQLNVGIGEAPDPLAGEVYNPGVGVKLEDIGKDTTFFPININNWWGHMNQAGDIVIWPQFDWSDYEFEGLIRVVHRGRTGFLNVYGKWAIEPQFAWADRFSDGVAIIVVDGKVGMVDKAATPIVPPKMDDALRFSEGLAAVQIGDRCGFIDRRGRVVVPVRFARVRSFHDGLAMVQAPAAPGQPLNSGTLAYIDKRGRAQFVDERGRFQDLGDFRDGLAPARVDGRWGFIDKSFRLRIEPVWDAVDEFSNGLAAVQKEGRIGYIDKSGAVVVPLEYRFAAPFSDDLGMVETQQRFGYVNRVGSVRIPFEYDTAEPFFRRYGRVAMPPNFGYLGVAGNVVWDPQRPFQVIWDRTTGGLARIAIDLIDPPQVNGFVQRQTSLRLLPPPPREPWPIPYQPEYLYLDELPRRR